MHELSLASGILKIVEDAAARERFARVRKLTLTVGALAGVDERALRFALSAIGRGTCLEGSEVVVETRPAMARCPSCQTEVPITSRLDRCPACNGVGLVPTGGTGLLVKDLTVLSAAEDAASPELFAGADRCA